MKSPELSFLWEIADNLGIKIKYDSLDKITTEAKPGLWVCLDGEDTIIINKDWFGSNKFRNVKLSNQLKSDRQDLAETLVREILHAIQCSPRIINIFNFNEELLPELNKILKDIRVVLQKDYDAIKNYPYVKDNYNQTIYSKLKLQFDLALENPDELIAFGITDPIFAKYLDSITYNELNKNTDSCETQLDRLLKLLNDTLNKAKLLNKEVKIINPFKQ